MTARTEAKPPPTTPIIFESWTDQFRPDPGSIGEQMLAAIREAERRDGIKRLLFEDVQRMEGLVRTHFNAWARFVLHNRRRRWFRPEMELDIGVYEVIIIRRPHSNATATEVRTWLETLDQKQRAVVCHAARQEWAEIRREGQIARISVTQPQNPSLEVNGRVND